MSDPQPTEQLRRRLRTVRGLALLDLLLLLALIASSLTGQRDFVRLLGPLHGSNFLLLLAVAATAALDGVWGWWFPAAILLTAGPLGAFLGEWAIGRRQGARASHEDGLATPEPSRRATSGHARHRTDRPAGSDADG